VLALPLVLTLKVTWQTSTEGVNEAPQPTLDWPLGVFTRAPASSWVQVSGVTSQSLKVVISEQKRAQSGRPAPNVGVGTAELEVEYEDDDEDEEDTELDIELDDDDEDEGTETELKDAELVVKTVVEFADWIGAVPEADAD
jgi:negative regulator of genetic competence, sporulation and motility